MSSLVGSVQTRLERDQNRKDRARWRKEQGFEQASGQKSRDSRRSRLFLLPFARFDNGMARSKYSMPKAPKGHVRKRKLLSLLCLTLQEVVATIRE